jgi:hypothetical protein
VFLCHIAEMNDRFLEHWINVKFCVQLGKIASYICEMFSEAWGEKLWKCEVFLSGLNGSKIACMSKSEMKTMLVTSYVIKGIVYF